MVGAAVVVIIYQGRDQLHWPERRMMLLMPANRNQDEARQKVHVPMR